MTASSVVSATWLPAEEVGEGGVSVVIAAIGF